ncbi:glycosyltransferase family 39 protein [Acidipila sp. EB88]|uniref:ArnT family glycosyltransferase n=1 Tax=Acidipila sp. EB88 TaxID=2305226 RepID=UPI000F5E6CF5|nr:hypothetical protein [Acidipila sp. EB88]
MSSDPSQTSARLPEQPGSHPALSAPVTRWLRIALAAWLFACLAALVHATLHWRMVNDPSQISYICFLIDHGMAPYRTIIEMNMPGIYFTNWTVTHLLGSSDLAWRAFDLSLSAVALGAMIVIARTYDWLGGLFAGALFVLFHGRDGAGQQGQRDLIISVLFLVAYACIFEALRRNKPSLFFLFGLCAATAGTIKPPALVFAALLLGVVCLHLRHERKPFARPVLLSAAGMLLPLATTAVLLARLGSLAAFWHTVRTMLPYYATLGRESVHSLLASSVTSSISTLFALGLLVAVLQRNGWNWERKLLLLGVAFGYASYLAQGKGFTYHRYPIVAFLLIWVGVECATALRGSVLPRALAYTTLLYGAVVAPMYVARASRVVWDEAFNQALQHDLVALGGSSLSGSVQCISMAADCDTTLLRLHLVQATGLMYDYFLFGSDSYQVIRESRQRFRAQFQQNPPRVVVLGRYLYPEKTDDYSKLQRWPEFARYLNAHYTLYDDRHFAPAECGFRGFRVYVLRSSKPPAPAAFASDAAMRAQSTGF